MRVQALLLMGLLLAVVGMQVHADEAPMQPITHVLVISLDGMRPDAILETDAPNLMTLAARGAYAWDAQTVLPSVTLIAHTSMLTGLAPDKHGVDYNDTPYPCLPIEAPTFVQQAADAGYRSAIVAGKEKFCIYDQSDVVDYTFARAGDASVVDRVIELLQDGTQVIFAHFPNPDYFGHLTGWMSAEYLYHVYVTDEEIGRLVAALDELGLTDETLILVTADHGGHDVHHGSDMPEDRHIPWILAGPGVVPGTELTDVSVLDTAPTVLWALGIQPAHSVAGLARIEAFGYPVQTVSEPNPDL